MKNILPKKQMAVLMVALMLIAAGYFNYKTNLQEEIEVSQMNEQENFSNEEPPIDAKLVDSEISQDTQNTIESEKEVDSNEEKENENIVTTMAKTEKDKQDYFINSKLERDKMYSQMLETYKMILESGEISETQKSIASTEIEKINSQKNAIMVSENLIKNKGFSNCIIFINNGSINVIVEAEELEQEKISQIQNIISREMNAEIENIHITNKNL